jgi:branched-chain amino acid transport system ATP-binding protein
VRGTPSTPSASATARARTRAACPPASGKRLELARALATGPRLLLLDEVTGGVDQATIPGLVRLVRDLHAGGLALVDIEHNMRVIMELSQRIVALQLGEVIASGAPADIVRDRRVIDAYLGETWRA